MVTRNMYFILALYVSVFYTSLVNKTVQYLKFLKIIPYENFRCTALSEVVTCCCINYDFKYCITISNKSYAAQSLPESQCI